MNYLTIAAFCLSTTFVLGQQADRSSAKPNVLLICIDDLRPELPSFGKDYIKAPHMEKLFKQGRLFKRHYVQAPTCGASRFSMLTGLYPDGEGQLGNSYIPLHPHKTHPTFPALFRQNGYHTVSIGKVSHYPGNLTGKNWNDPSKPEIPNAWDLCPKTNAEWEHPQGLMHGYADGVARIPRKSPATEAKAGRYPDDAIIDAYKQQVRKITQQEKPWLLAVGLIRPHLPFACHKKYLDLYEQVKLPTISANKKPSKGEYWHTSNECLKTYTQPSDPRKDAKQADVLRRHYAACVSSTDDHIGTILKELKATGADKNTVIVLWADHGWHLGEHKIWGKHSPYAVALHSPLFIKTPSSKSAGIESNEIVETIDLYPTLCDLAKVSKPSHLDGKSLVGILDNPNSKSDGEAISFWGTLKSSITMDEHKIIDRNSGKLTQHYNLKSDPHETTNLISN